MRYYKKIVGERCYLSPVNIEDAPKYTEWLNDLEISSTLQITHQVLSEEIEKEILQKLSKENLLAIVDIKNDELIGSCGFINIDHLNRIAEFGIFIGNKKYLGKGYGTEATNLTLDFGFNLLNLNNIMLTVYSYNTRAMECYEKCGFKVIGRRRDARVIGGKPYDVIYMDILAEEFKNSVIKKYF
jgi:RimJ/RimL family protein N-acetyltransferase